MINTEGVLKVEINFFLFAPLDVINYNICFYGWMNLSVVIKMDFRLFLIQKKNSFFRLVHC